MSANTIAIEQLFHDARTANGFLDKAVTDATLAQLYDTMKWAPTAANSSPARIIFVRQGEAREKLLSAMSPGNVDKTRSAPVTAILAYDSEFYEQLPKLFPHADARSWYVGNAAFANETAQYNAALQHGYFIIAARAAGLDTGPMAGFDKAKMDEIFLSGTTWKSALVVNLGYGDPSKLYPRSPRLSFEEATKVIG
jgi:3-hydroxypropanoate dehydrogenase